MAIKKRDIEFLYELGSLRHIQRSWRQAIGKDVANDLEHTLRVVWLALILAEREGGCDKEKLIKMALVHDLAETKTGDQNHQQALYVKADEERALHDLLAGTSLTDFTDIAREYQTRESLEAKIVKDADNLDADLELRELDQQGSKLPAKWKKLRRLVRDKKLYTKAARELWDKINQVDVAAWHLQNNKLYKVPDAGK
ncbi:MAG: HD domain-containing protein [bacterium]|nr:HD domain-containing protein [bacterium]